MSNVSIDPAQRRRSDPLDDAVTRGPAPAASAQAVRAAARARYEALVSQGAPNAASCDPFDDSDDVDYDKPLTNDVQGGTLFRTQEGDVTAVAARDIQQRNLGDCYVMASLSALASTDEGRAVISNHISENKNEKGEVVSYNVTLYKVEKHWFKADTVTPVTVTVQGPFSCYHAGTRSEDGGQPELWPMIYEKAYAQLQGGYNAMGHGGSAADAMMALTGKPATASGIERSGKDTVAKIRSALAAGKMVDLGSPKTDKTLPCGVVDDHEYTVVGVFSKDGKDYVVLRNPWGHADPDPVPVDELSKAFDELAIGDVK